MIHQLKTDHATLMRDLHAIYRHHDIPPTKGPNNARRALAKKLGIDLPPIGAALMTLKVHELHAQGFASIGCAPCTRALRPGEPERAGRWWWEEDAARECGLHVDASGKLVRSKAA